VKIIFHADAIAEARSARRWYSERDVEAGDVFMSALDDAVALISRTPRMWPTFEGGTRRYLLKTFPFSLIYRTHMDGIQVVAVMHERRRPGYWLGRRQ
jgi:plasmid stabilization system protein ParE